MTEATMTAGIGAVTDDAAFGRTRRGETTNDALEALKAELPLHIRQVSRWVAHLGGPNVEVADVTQEVFLQAHRNLSSFRGNAKLTTWLYTITVRVLRRKRRKEWLRRWLSGSATEAAGDLASPSDSPAELLQSRQQRERVYSLLERLPEKHRTALILSEYEEMSNAQIAELLDIRPSTVSVWVHRAKAQLIKEIRKLDEQEELHMRPVPPPFSPGDEERLEAFLRQGKPEGASGDGELLSAAQEANIASGIASASTGATGAAWLSTLAGKSLLVAGTCAGLYGALHAVDILGTQPLPASLERLALGAVSREPDTQLAPTAVTESAPVAPAPALAEVIPFAEPELPAEAPEVTPVPSVTAPPAPPVERHQPVREEQRRELLAAPSSSPVAAVTRSAEATLRGAQAGVHSRDSGPVATPLGASIAQAGPETRQSPESPLAMQARLLGEALRQLRQEQNGSAALETLGRLQALHPGGPFTTEARAAEVEAHLLQRDTGAALAVLEGLDETALSALPQHASFHVLRGELLMESKRWFEAMEYFALAMAHGASSGLEERARWGSAVCRLQLGQRAHAARALEAYVKKFPYGRFAAESQRLLGKL